MQTKLENHCTEQTHALGSLPRHARARNTAQLIVKSQDILLGMMMEFSVVL